MRKYFVMNNFDEVRGGEGWTKVPTVRLNHASP